MNQHSSTRIKYCSPLIAAALVSASLFRFSLPVFAAGTEAGTRLLNTATGEYEDDAGTTYPIESNTVEVIVAKIAGITNVPSGFNDETSGAGNNSVLTGDTVSFEFTVTNVGNDVADIFIPSTANIATKGLDPNTLVITVDTDGDGNFEAVTPDASGNIIIPNVAVDGEVIVKVQGTVTATAAGAPIEVQLGDTGTNTDPNNPQPDTQNRPDDGADDGTDIGSTYPVDVAQADNEVRTLTSSTATVGGDPSGGQREASAVQQVFLGSNPLAMARIEKTNAGFTDPNPGQATDDLADNVITYNLELDVLANTPNSLFTPGALEGRNYTVPGTGSFGTIGDQTNLVLISDAIPENTTYVANSATNTDTDWTPVYTTDPLTTPPDEATWETTEPAGVVTRVGWVYDANANNPLPVSSIVTGFQFQVTTTGFTAANGAEDGGTIANIAQVYGTTDDGAAGASGGEVFDESGDQNPTNFNDDGSVGPDETVANPDGTFGQANPADHGVDSGNDNNAGGAEPPSPGGEDNIITISAVGDLLNGPNGQPAASGNVFGVGPDNNHDFQNLGVDITEDEAGNPITPDFNNTTTPFTFNPKPVTFENTLSNPTGSDLDQVLLQPINPGFTGIGGDNADLPTNTEVTIDLGGQIATYTYDGSTFTLTTGAPIVIPTLASGVPLNYSVTVDLPSNTGLSTDDAVNSGFPVPLIAFIDDDDDGTPDANENANVTVNQVYTGYLKLNKQVQVLDPDGNVRGGMGYGDPDTAKNPLPGDILEYRVIYRNISEAQVGSGTNGVLNAVNVEIEENGTKDFVDDGILNESDNNWATDNNGDGDLDTLNVQNEAIDSGTGVISFFTGSTGTTPAGTIDPGEAVTSYLDEIPLVAPAGAEAAGNFFTVDAGDFTFTFRRKVDDDTN